MAPISRGLLWTAFFILIIGGSITYLFFLQGAADPAARTGMLVTAMLTVIATGICLICATANWWLYH